MGNYNRKMNSRRSRRPLLLLIGVLAVLLIAALVLVIVLTGGEPEQTPTDPPLPTETETTPVMENRRDISINLGYGLTATQVGSYTGAFVEDGSNEFVSGVLMLRVMNTGEQDVQYAEITMALGEGQAEFILSTLPVGESVILLEQSRQPWDQNEKYEYAIMNNVVLFEQPISLLEDQLAVQLLPGGMNVQNISDQDITGDIVIYYKNAQEGLYYGGITYRMRLEGGMKAGELRQLMADHISATGSEVMFITIT